MQRYGDAYRTLVARSPHPVKYESDIEPEKLKKAIIQMQSGFSVRFVPAVYDTKNNEFYIGLKKGGYAAKASGRLFEELQTYPEDFKDFLWCYPIDNNNLHNSDRTAFLVLSSNHLVPSEVAQLLHSVEGTIRLGSLSLGKSGEIEFG